MFSKGTSELSRDNPAEFAGEAARKCIAKPEDAPCRVQDEDRAPLAQLIALWDTGSEASRYCTALAVGANVLLSFGTPLCVAVFGPTGLLIAAVMLGSLVVAAALLRYPVQQRQAIRALACLDAPRVVRPLTEALRHPSPHVRSVAVIALARQLPTMRDDIAFRLTDAHRRVLRLCLLSRNPALVVAALDLLRELGDVDALPSVRRVYSLWRRGAEAEAVRSAALVCEEHLKSQIARVDARDSLLRPVRERPLPSTSSGYGLVRPVLSQSIPASRELLRPEVAPEKSAKAKNISLVCVALPLLFLSGCGIFHQESDEQY